MWLCGDTIDESDIDVFINRTDSKVKMRRNALILFSVVGFFKPWVGAPAVAVIKNYDTYEGTFDVTGAALDAAVSVGVSRFDLTIPASILVEEIIGFMVEELRKLSNSSNTYE